MNLSKKTLHALNCMLFITTLGMNYLSNTGTFNGETIKMLSDRYQTLFTPEAYAFSIWGLIYLFLLGFLIYCSTILKKREESEIISLVGIWFSMTCLANCFWIFAWLYDFTGLSVILMGLLLFALIQIIRRTHMELTNPPFRIVAFVWWPFALYSGWVSVALIVNVAAFLTKLKWSGFGLSEITWTIIMILVAGAINVFMTWKRNLREFAMVGVWALIAIAMTNRDDSQIIFWTAIIIAILVTLSCFVHSFKNFKGFGKTYQDFKSET